MITANEGSAVALAAGYHLATNNIGVVYMQNSGQGNAVNPLTSLADPDVYSIPMLLLIGWRGEPGVSDEPQHVKQGKITLSLLETLGIPYEILPNKLVPAKESITKAIKYMKEKQAPYALVIKKGTFADYQIITKYEGPSLELSREEAIKLIAQQLNSNEIIVSTTGKASRELYEYREGNGKDHSRDFLTVGSMGHASQIALGMALTKTDREVVCLDGDGAAIMHAGALAIIGTQAPKNFKHIILNNGSHESVGGQPTAGFNINFPAIALACGYKSALTAETAEQLIRQLVILKTSPGPVLLEVKVRKGARADLGRPTITPIENKKSVMESLKTDIMPTRIYLPNNNGRSYVPIYGTT